MINFQLFQVRCVDITVSKVYHLLDVTGASYKHNLDVLLGLVEGVAGQEGR